MRSILFFVLITVFLISTVIAGTIAYEGKLSSGGLCQVKFSLWDSDVDGELKWQETQEVDIVDGSYKIQLGAVNAIDAELLKSGQLWLQTDVVGKTATEVSVERELLDKVAYAAISDEALSAEFADRAAEADNADTVGGYTAAELMSGDDWLLTGNSGTSPGANFIGTTDNQKLYVKVNNQTAFRLEPHETSPNVIAGSYKNYAKAGVFGATISGGGKNYSENKVTDAYGTVCGGRWNTVGDNDTSNTNVPYATVGGGYKNTASGHSSTVPGGFTNTAAGNKSFAAGNQAKANHQGTFVWADSTLADFASTDTNQFLIRANGGVGINTNDPEHYALKIDGQVGVTGNLNMGYAKVINLRNPNHSAGRSH